MKKYLFEKEMRLFSIKRSGSSAIVSFLLGHYEPQEIVYLHNTDFSFRTRDRAINPFEFYQEMEARNPDDFKCFLNTSEHNYPIQSSFALLAEKFRDRNYVYNVDKMWYANYAGYGSRRFSENVYNIVLLRSAHNNLASILRILEVGKGFQKHIFHNFTEDWLMYAREVLGETNYIPDKVVCLFDKWFESEEYRIELSNKLGLKYCEDGIHNVIRNVGSSFDGFRYEDKAQEMKVLDRWEYYRKNDTYLKKLNNEELIAKNKALFDINLRGLLFES